MTTHTKSHDTPTSGVPRFEPEVFGKYFLLQRMAVGGMAEVIRAKTLGAGGFQKELVVKRILPKLAKDHSFVRMFVNEAKITVGLTHPNIAQIFELGQVGETYFMSMELVDGIQVRELVPLFREHRLGVDHAVWLCLEALKGLDHAHRATDALGVPLGIVHCDISPDNLMVTFDAGVKVVDFGIARAATGLSNAKSGTVMGKVNYLSPEQATAGAVDARTDVFAVGVVLYHLLTGAYPYGRFERLEDLVPLVAGEVPYIAAREHDKRIPDELDPILKRAVAVRREDRFPDARALMVALEETLYPTPHSAIAEHLRVEVGRTFASHRDRMARLRANDETVMRILGRRVEAKAKDESPDLELVEALTRQRDHTRTQRTAPVRRPRPRRRSPWRLSLAQLAVSVLLAAALAASGLAGWRWLAPGALVITSTPPGARVIVDGTPAPGVTPVVLQGMNRHKRYRIRVQSAGHADWTGAAVPDGRGVTVVNADLESQEGDLEVESVPPGAEVFLDDAPRGRTPTVLRGVDLRVPHKLELRRRGFEPDAAVLQHLHGGDTVKRVLHRAGRRRRR